MTVNTTMLMRGSYIIDDYSPLKGSVNTSPNAQEFTPIQRMIPHNYREQQTQFGHEILLYQTLNPAMSGMFRYISELKEESDQLKTTTAEMENCLKMHSDAIFISIAEKLYRIIRESPKLSTRLQQLQLKDQNVEIKSLIEKLEAATLFKKSDSLEEWVFLSSTSDPTLPEKSWICVDKEPEVIFIDTDAMLLEELQNQIATLQRAVKGSSNSQEFMLEMSELRKQTLPPKSSKVWTNLYNAGTTAIAGMKGLYYVANVVISVTPTILKIAPFIFPLGWLKLLQILVTVIQGSGVG
jgi:hypothetical protein